MNDFERPKRPTGRPKQSAKKPDLYNEIAEQEVLAALFAAPDRIFGVMRALSPTAFYKAAHSSIYQAMINVVSQKNASEGIAAIVVSVPTVAEELNRMGVWRMPLGDRLLDEVYLRDIDRLGTLYVVGNLQKNVSIVQTSERIRTSVTLALQYADNIQQDPAEYEAYNVALLKELYGVANNENSPNRRDSSIGAIIKAENEKPAPKPVPSGIAWFDEVVSFKPSFIFNINGPLKQRKTSFARALMLQRAKAAAPIIWFTTDGNREVATASWQALVATEILKSWNVPQAEWRMTSLNLRTRQATDVERDALAAADKILTDSHIHIFDNVDNIESIRQTQHRLREMRMRYQEYSEFYVVYDFLQNMHPDEYRAQSDWSGSPLIQATRMMRNFITSNGATGILLNQLSVESIGNREKNRETSGIKGGNYPAEVADYNVNTYYNKGEAPDRMKVEFGLTRYEAPTQPIYYRIHPGTGLILNPNYPFDMDEETPNFGYQSLESMFDTEGV